MRLLPALGKLCQQTWISEEVGGDEAFPGVHSEEKNS